MGGVLSRDEKLLYVSTGRGGSVAVIDVATRKQVRSFDGAGNRPWGIALSRDGKHIYTANGTSSDLSLVDPATGNVDKRVQIGGLPWGVALATERAAPARNASGVSCSADPRLRTLLR